MKKTIAGEISRGIATGMMYAEIARNIRNSAMVSMRKAMTIARTEGHRIQEEARYESMKKAKEAGADIIKQWDSTLDKRTRPTHQKLDGQIRELDEPFEVNGMKAMYPSGFGKAKEDINCRCIALQRAKWALDEEELNTLKERAKHFGLDKTKDFDDFKEKYLKSIEEMEENVKIKEKDFDIIGNTKKLKSAMDGSDYDKYMKYLTGHKNKSLQKIYAKYADGISGVKKGKSGAYCPDENRLEFSYPLQKYIDNGRNKYHTLAHEYGHYFDAKAEFSEIHFSEVDLINGKTKFTKLHKVVSSSDEFLSAARKDRELLKGLLTEDIKKELKAHDGSAGVQDAIDGLLAERVNWGHGDKYYNRKYSGFKKLKEHKILQDAYKELGIDASKLSDVAHECRVYESASEMWANIISAEVCGGSELEYVKRYLPNSYQAMLNILKGVK